MHLSSTFSIFFFFSSRRRHTRSLCDWSSDVCSSDLGMTYPRTSERDSIARPGRTTSGRRSRRSRSEEHTSELQSHSDLVCRLLLEKKKATLTPRGSLPYLLNR